MNSNKRSHENSLENMPKNKRVKKSKSKSNMTVGDELNELVRLLEIANPELLTTAASEVAQGEGPLNPMASIDLVSPECVAADESIDSMVQVYAFHDDSHGDDICSQVEIPEASTKPIILQNVLIATPSSEVATVASEAVASTSLGVSAVASPSSEVSAVPKISALACMPAVDTMRVAMSDALLACQNESAALESRAILIKKRIEEIKRELRRVCQEEVINTSKLRKVNNLINSILIHLHELGRET